MATTAQTVIDRAVARSALNEASLVPTTQLLGYMTTAERRIYILAARLNPNYFGSQGNSATRPSATASWNLDNSPGSLVAVTKLEVAVISGTLSGVAVGDEVHLVDFRYPDIQVSPRAYLRGKDLYGVGTDLGSGVNYVSQLVVYYSKLPPAITSTSQNISLPDEWVDLLVVPLARILALRDKREEEVQLFDQEYASLMQQFSEQCLVYEHGATRPLNAVPAIPIFGKQEG